jgi:hypothetical protein
MIENPHLTDATFGVLNVRCNMQSVLGIDVSKDKMDIMLISDHGQRHKVYTNDHPDIGY